MRFSKVLTVMVVFSLALTGMYCTKTEDPVKNTSPLVGTWVANSDVPGTQMIYDGTDTNPLFILDGLQLGASIQITIKNDNTYSMTLSLPGEAPELEDGNWSVNANQITLTPKDFPEDAITFTYAVSGDMATLASLDGEVTFDFGAGEIPVTMIIVLKKTTT
ncbi:MAG: hypothetical protein E4H13_05780 [Calditrichales bacterium]|nr:MAG: hypothetical protein E4H13_05780 [Calditrichales bacterium]